MDYNPASVGGNHHIIVAIDYFMKWVEDMPTIKYDGETAVHFIFNQIITQFSIPKELVTNHGRHLQNKMMEELASKLGYKQEHSSSYYPQANGQVEAMNKSLKSILQQTIAQSKMNWHIMSYISLWAYRTMVNTTISFSHISSYMVWSLYCRLNAKSLR